MALPSPIVDDFPEFTMMRPLPSVPEMGVPELGQERERLEIYHLRVRPRDDDEPRARQQAHAAEDQPYKSTFDHEDSSHVQLRLPQFTLQGRVKVSEEDDIIVRQKIDKHLLPVLAWAYFLKVLTGTLLDDQPFQPQTLHLTGIRHTLFMLISPIAQAIWQPLSIVLLVRVPPRILLPALMLGWGIVHTCTAAAANCFVVILVVRFLVGLLEGSVLPLLCLFVSGWYRRREQPVRIAVWFGMNGIATIVKGGMAYGFERVGGTRLVPWQIACLLTGPLTILSAPFIHRFLPTDPSTAPFLTEAERLIAGERLRANQSGTDLPPTFRPTHLRELLLDPKTYLFFLLSVGTNLGAQVAIHIGPAVLDGDPSLFSMPFGAVQLLSSLLVCWAAGKVRCKSLTMGTSLVPIIVGLVLLFTTARTEGNKIIFVVGYYLMGVVFGLNALLVSWMVANTAGLTKKSGLFSVYNIASSVGTIIAVLIHPDSLDYQSGLKTTLGVYIAIFWAVVMQVVALVLLNRMQEKRRTSHGKPTKIRDTSMEGPYIFPGALDPENSYVVGNFAFADLTDRENDEFIYVY